MSDPAFAAWIAGTQLDLEFWATVRDQGTVVADQVPVSGELVWTRPEAVVRTGDVVFSTLKPKWLAAGLDRGWTADLWVSVRQGSTVSEVQLGRYRALSTEWYPGAPAVAAQLADEITLINDARFFKPYTARKGWTYYAAIRRVATTLGIPSSSDGYATIVDDTRWGSIPTTLIRAPITVDRERLELFQILNERLHTQVFFSRTGQLLSRIDPAYYYRKSANRIKADHALTDPALFRVEAVKFEREGQSNALVVQPGETDETFWYSWRPVLGGDYYYGPRFGSKPAFYSSDLLDTKALAEAAIDAMLPDYADPAKTLTITTPPWWWIEAGQVIALPGAAATPPRYVIAALRLPLGLGDMTIDLESIDAEQYEVPEYGDA